MSNIDQIQLPNGSQYNIKDDVSGYATTGYVQDQISAIDKTTVGLGNVDNTSDANKPVSTAQQTALNGKTNTSIVAYVESSTTATKRYEIGDRFILNGVLYKATSIIPNEGTIEVGTNCVADDSLTTQINTVRNAVATKANKADLTNLDLTGTTNSTGSTISAGTYFYLNGTLVRAKVDIASGATFTLNTNYEIISDGALNQDSGWILLNSTYELYYRKIGNVVWVKGKTAITSNNWQIIATLPDGYRPPLNVYRTLVYTASDNYRSTICFLSNGQIQNNSNVNYTFMESFLLD